eukprot:c21976_g2_i1.p1 GENE.c21976_g2_i1~~c21976_g2_i1.p1  ORF type:complete len:212 (+),score=83.00 c21976_g2_i1:1-636(+)
MVSPQVFSPQLLKSISKRLQTFSSETLTPFRTGLKKPGVNRKAGILIPLCNINHQSSIIFTLRTDKVGSFKGHVSFPGGHTEEGETAEECAIRETNEEIGLDPKTIQVLGKYRPIYSTTGILVTPVIAFTDISTLSDLVVSEKEVEKVYSISIEDLIDPFQRATQNLDVKGETISVPLFNSGPKQIWGLTAFVLDQVLKTAICPSIFEQNQ